MKSVLYGSSALVAAGLLAGGAAAQGRQGEQPIRVAIGGYFNAFFAVGDQDDGPGEAAEGLRDHMIAREAEIHFLGETTFDNGLSVGVEVQLEAETCDDQIDESYVYFEGKFGRLEVGAEDGAPDSMFYGAPTPISGLGVATPDIVVAAVPNSVATPVTIVNISGDSEKVTYFTPPWPVSSSVCPMSPIAAKRRVAAAAIPASRPRTTPASSRRSMRSAFNYVTSFNALEVGLYAGYADATLEANDAAGTFDDQEQWGAGFLLGWRGWSFGGQYRHDNQGLSADNSEREDWAVGVAYSPGDWRLGLQYVNATAEEGPGLGEDETQAVELGATYNLGPGVDVAGGVQWWDVADNAGAAGAENDALIFILGTNIAF